MNDLEIKRAFDYGCAESMFKYYLQGKDPIVECEKAIDEGKHTSYLYQQSLSYYIDVLSKKNKVAYERLIFLFMNNNMDPNKYGIFYEVDKE